MNTAADLFTRQGDKPRHAVRVNAKGRPYFLENRPCLRCGGQGGARHWPGFTCYRCGGACNDPAGPFTVKLYTADELARLNATKAKRDARRAAIAAEKAAAEQAARDARAADFLAAYGELLSAAEPYAARSEFVADVCGKARARAAISPAQADALRAAVARFKADDAKRAASAHVGKIGARLECPVAVERVASFSRPCFGAAWQLETVYIVTMRTDDGAALVCKSPRFCPEKGARLTIRATVKEHSEYKGEAQTLVQRVTIKQTAPEKMPALI